MSRVQMLDVGDRVVHSGHAGVIVGVERITDGYTYTVDWGGNADGMSRAGWSRSQLARVGGMLQKGDWVRVSGASRDGLYQVCMDDRGLITDDFASGGFQVFTWRHQMAYKFQAADLTRITRAEALA